MSSQNASKGDLPTVALHWALVATLFFSLSTGLRISADSENAFWSKALSFIALQGDVMRWHVWAAFALTLISGAYVVFLLQARLKSRVVFDQTRLRALIDGERVSRWRAVNVLLYWLAFVLIAIAACTGTLLYFFSGVAPHEIVIMIHRAVAWLIIGYVIAHAAAQIGLGGVRHLLKIMIPRPAYAAAAGVATLSVAVAAAAIYTLDTTKLTSLDVAVAATVPTLDGVSDDAAWRTATPVKIHTVRGANLPGGEVPVKVRAVHDGESIYALFEWEDDTFSQKHLPLIKTSRGWEVVQTEYGRQDEDSYYEDKFSVMLANQPQLAGAGSTHLGPQPIADKPGPKGGRGLHYTDGGIVDVWHWKSVRTGSADARQMDDNYFGPPMEPPADPGKRYTGGYTQDPHEGGGYKMNWEAYSDDVVTPRRLPKNPRLIAGLAGVNLDPNVSEQDGHQFWMAMSDTVPYSEELDTYPVGTVMPSVLIEGPRKGDRGDVTAVSRWHEGKWYIEVKRKLNTNSEFDIPLTAESEVYMWVAVFDHAQTRHSLHLHPIRVRVM